MNKICELPTAWLNRVSGKKTLSAPPSSIASLFPVSDDLSAGVDLGFKLPDSVGDGQGRESTILSYAGKLRSNGMSQELIERAVLDYNKLHISPPLDEETVLERARRYAAKESEQSQSPRLALTDGIVTFSQTPPPPRAYVFEDRLVLGKSYILAGLGGVSKTMFAMQLGVTVSLGAQFMGKGTLAGSVLMVLGEEDQAEINRRLGAIAVANNLSKSQTGLITKRLRAFPMLGIDARLTVSRGGSLEPTNFATEVIQAAKSLAQESGSPPSLIVLDHAGLIHGGEFNGREDVVHTMRIVNYIADQTGAALLLLAHSPKTSTGDKSAGSEDIAGSTAWVDHARGAFILRAMSESESKPFGITSEERKDYVSLTTVKNNYGPSGDVDWLSKDVVPRWGVSVLKHVTLTKPVTTTTDTGLQKRILTLVLEKNALTVNKVCGSYSGKSGPLKASKKDIEIALDQLIDEGRLLQVEPTPEERKQHNIPRQAGYVLRLPE